MRLAKSFAGVLGFLLGCLFLASLNYMTKSRKTPRPPKPPFLPLEDHHTVNPIISDAHKILIGSVVERWSKLEAVMDDLIWSMLKLQFETGKVITNRLDASGKIKLIRQIASFTLTEDQQHRLSPIIDRIDFRREDRNFIAHGSWGTLMPEHVPICSSLRPTARNPDEVVAETFTDGRMREIADEIESLKLRLVPLKDELGTSPRKPHAPRPAE
jgi:hypothetical protein